MNKLAVKSLVIAVISCISAGAFAKMNANYKMETFPQVSPGFRYVGLALGYGIIDSNTLPFISSLIGDTGDIAPIIPPLLNGKSDNGGFSGRFYTGYLFNVTPSFLMGPEIGFSLYHNSYGSENGSAIGGVVNALGGAGEDPTDCTTTTSSQGCSVTSIQLSYDSTSTTKGYGLDLLFSANYQASPNLLLYAKPGIQLAYEKTWGNVNFKYGQTETLIYAPTPPNTKTIDPPVSIPVVTSYSEDATLVAPEIILGGSWKLPGSLPFYIGASYQYVFSTWNNVQDKTSSRSLLSFNLEYYV